MVLFNYCRALDNTLTLRYMSTWCTVKLWSALDNTLIIRCSDLRFAIGNLKSLPSQDALILSRSSFSAPKIMHTLRCAPCSCHPQICEFDNPLRDGISIITNSLLSDLQWSMQASQSEMEAWGSVLLHRWLVPRFWLLLRAPRFFRTSSCHRPHRFLIIRLCFLVQVGPIIFS